MGQRHQRGSIQKKNGAFYVVYRNTERKVIWHRLCTIDRTTSHGSKSAMAVRLLAEDFMRAVNADDGEQPQAALTIVQFWNDVYLPFIKDNKKSSTVGSYQQVFEKHLKAHFADKNKTLGEYRTPMMTNHLTALAKTLRPRTLKHIKFMASGLFAHAVATGHCESNPIRDAQVLGKTLPDGETGYYSLEEIEDIISALVDHVDCQLIMALAYFLGLRKGEIAGLRWGDIDADFIHVRRNIVRGQITTLKGKKKEKDLPLIQPVRGLLMLWRAKAGDGASTMYGVEAPWVIDRAMNTIARKTISPVLKKAGLEWKGFHAGRRGLGTILKQLTGNSTAGRDVLGHTDEVVTREHYEMHLLQSVVAPLKLLEAKVSKQ
jgi:integrase